MLGRNRSSILSLLLSALLLASLAAVFSCDQSPTSDSKNPGDLSGTAKIEPGLSGQVMLGAVTDTVAPFGRIEVWATNISFDPDSGMVTMDVRLTNRTQRTLTPTIHFVITDIRPDDIAVVDFDGSTGDGFPFYDFSDVLGDDAVLSPGESTGPVTMKFHTVTARSFAIGFRIEFSNVFGGGVIAGVVFRDDNQNGERERCDRCEPGIPGITVVLIMPGGGDDPGDSTVTWPYPGASMVTKTAENGSYRFEGLPEGFYTVLVIVNPDRWKVTSTYPLYVTLVTGPDGRVQSFLDGDFGLYPRFAPPPSDELFGPILVGPHSRFGVLLDSTFVNPPSNLTVVYHYYMDVALPPFEGPWPVIVDTAAAWINDELVFEFGGTADPDSSWFLPQTISIRDGLVSFGENTIRLYVNGNEFAAVMWRVYRSPMIR